MKSYEVEINEKVDRAPIRAPSVLVQFISVLPPCLEDGSVNHRGEPYNMPKEKPSSVYITLLIWHVHTVLGSCSSVKHS
jgi:hypothetical protein